MRTPDGCVVAKMLSKLVGRKLLSERDENKYFNDTEVLIPSYVGRKLLSERDENLTAHQCYGVRG